MSLIYLAIYTGFTRISDYKHHWSDVLIGLLQGTIAAIVTSHYVGRFFRRYPEKVRSPDHNLLHITTYVRPPSRSELNLRSSSPSSPHHQHHSSNMNNHRNHSSQNNSPNLMISSPNTTTNHCSNTTDHHPQHSPANQSLTNHPLVSCDSCSMDMQQT